MADPAAAADPVLDIRVRWRAGQVLLALAGLLTLVALARPLAPWSPPWLKASAALAISLGVSAAALLSSLRGRKRPETIALHGFLVLSLDALGQLVGAHGFPTWPLLALLVASLAVAEGLAPIRDAYLAMSDAEVTAVMDKSAAQARVSADETMALVKEAVGLS